MSPLTNPVRPLALVFYNPSVTTTNIPAAVQEYGNNSATRIIFDISAFVECKVTVNVFTAAPNGGSLRIQYSTDNSSFSDLTANASLTATGLIQAAWQTIPDAAKGQEVYMRIVTSGGNAADDPITVQVVLSLR
jgi:hypothetical protein